MEVEGTLVRIRPLRLSDAPALLDLRVRNQEAFAPFFPRQSGFFFTIEGQEREIERGNLEWQSDEGYVFGVFVHDDERSSATSFFGTLLAGRGRTRRWVIGSTRTDEGEATQPRRSGWL